MSFQLCGEQKYLDAMEVLYPHYQNYLLLKVARTSAKLPVPKKSFSKWNNRVDLNFIEFANLLGLSISTDLLKSFDLENWAVSVIT